MAARAETIDIYNGIGAVGADQAHTPEERQMSYQIQRAVMIGFHVVVIVAGACLPPPPGVACDDGWCPSGKLCMQIGENVSTQQSMCVAPGVCGNSIIEADEECDCGDGGIVVSSALCAGGGNSDAGGFCRTDCKLHCGDGKLAADEVCDTNLPTTSSCVVLGYDFGKLSCSTSCDKITTDTCGMWSWQSLFDAAGMMFRGIWGTGRDNIFVVEADGEVFHYDGAAWHSAITFEGGGPIQSVWGSNPNDVFVVWSTGDVLHYDGAQWTLTHPSGTNAFNSLYGLWGNGSNDVFAVGAWGTILHYNGIQWTPMTSNTPESLLGVWGSGPDDVFITGAFGTILHYDGARWTFMQSGITDALYGVWGSRANDIFAVGDNGVVLHYDGIRWGPMHSNTSSRLHGVRGSASDDVFAVGSDGVVLHYDGTQWHTTKPGGTARLTALWESDTQDVFIVGDNGTILKTTLEQR